MNFQATLKGRDACEGRKKKPIQLRKLDELIIEGTMPKKTELDTNSYS